MEPSVQRHALIRLLVLFSLLGSAEQTHGQQSNQPTRATVTDLRRTFTAPPKSQFETEAEYRARLPQAPQASFLIRVPPTTCNVRNTALNYDAERGVLVFNLLGEDTFLRPTASSASSSFAFPHLDRSSSETNALIIWESCTATEMGSIPMSNAFGATVNVQQTTFAGTGVLVPRGERGFGNHIWKFETLMDRDAARALIGRASTLLTEIEICLLPDDEGNIPITSIQNIYPEVSNPVRQVRSVEMVRGSVRSVHIRDPASSQNLLSFQMNHFCDSEQLERLARERQARESEERARVERERQRRQFVADSIANAPRLEAERRAAQAREAALRQRADSISRARQQQAAAAAELARREGSAAFWWGVDIGVGADHHLKKNTTAGSMAIMGGFEVGVLRLGLRPYDAMMIPTDENPYFLFRYGGDIRVKPSVRSSLSLGVGWLEYSRTTIPVWNYFEGALQDSAPYAIVGLHSASTVGFRSGLDIRVFENRADILITFYGAFR